MEEARWQARQRRVFTNWINAKLRVRSLPPVVNLYADLRDGFVCVARDPPR